MNIHVQTTDFQSSEAIDAYLEKRAQSLEKFVSPGAQLHVHFRREPSKQRKGESLYVVEFLILDEGQEYRSEHGAHDPYASIDGVKDDIQRIIRKERESQRDVTRKGMRDTKKLIKEG